MSHTNPRLDAADLPKADDPAKRAVLARLVEASPWSDHVPHLIKLVAQAGAWPLRGVEVGVGWGYGAAGLLAFVPQIALHVMVDTWWTVWPSHRYFKSQDAGAKVDLATFARMHGEALATTEFAGRRRRIVRSNSAEAALAYAGAGLDYAFIDGDHSVEGVTIDLKAWWPALRSGALIVGHDWGRFGVEAAVRGFGVWRTEDIGLHPESLWSARKP